MLESEFRRLKLNLPLESRISGIVVVQPAMAALQLAAKCPVDREQKRSMPETGASILLEATNSFSLKATSSARSAEPTGCISVQHACVSKSKSAPTLWMFAMLRWALCWFKPKPPRFLGCTHICTGGMTKK